MIRTFAVSAEAGGIVHDPASGLTYSLPDRGAVGRQTLDESVVGTAPVLHPRALDRSVPVSLCWSPLVRCNLSCPHCLDDTTVHELGRPDRERVADVLAAADVLGVDISGGEPLLLRELPALARRIAAGGKAAVSVTTNGWHLARRAEELRGAVDAVRVSLDGPDAARHDRWRGDGSFARAADGVREAVAAGLPVQIQTVLMAATRTYAQDMVDLAVKLGAGGVTFLQMLSIGAGADLAKSQALPDPVANDTIAPLDTPPGFRLRLRLRDADASGFTVIRADGRVWRNTTGVASIATLHPLQHTSDLGQPIAGVAS
jgi:sulfatase maturation enzyme AslB (radical SAM superfamily)